MIRSVNWRLFGLISFCLFLVFQIVEFYLKMIVNRGNSLGGQKFVALSTFFWACLVEEANWQEGRGKKVQFSSDSFVKQNLLGFGKILIPINLNKLHWILAVCDVEERKVSFYDSMIRSEQNLKARLG